MSEETTVQSDDNAVNNPTTEGSKNNANVPQSVMDRISKLSGQKNDLSSQLEEANAKNAEFVKAQDDARQKKMVENEEFKTLLSEKDAQIEKLTQVSNQWNTYQEETRASLMEKLPEGKREFGEGMDLSKLQKFVETEVQSVNPNANKTNTARQGVNPTGEFGGFDSWQEFAMKDPKGAEKALAAQTNNYIK
jgi:hypothetical protein